MKVMTKEQLIKLAGSQVELAKLLGISQPAVSAWKAIPKARIWQLKLLRPEWFEVIK
jgi:predicted transcriptional regulator